MKSDSNEDPPPYYTTHSLTDLWGGGASLGVFGVINCFWARKPEAKN